MKNMSENIEGFEEIKKKCIKRFEKGEVNSEKSNYKDVYSIIKLYYTNKNLKGVNKILERLRLESKLESLEMNDMRSTVVAAMYSALFSLVITVNLGVPLGEDLFKRLCVVAFIFIVVLGLSKILYGRQEKIKRMEILFYKICLEAI
ncbi:hypothetical protein LFJ66_000130 [Clostridium perfringens]|nr:hypothetical protein [Clostridium perfringens]